MKIPLKQDRQEGNVLLLTMAFGAIVGLILLSYLQLIQSRVKIRARSQAWNQAIPVLEQGVEEACSHLHSDTYLSSNKWTTVGTGSSLVYKRTRTNSDSTYFIVTISNAISAPYHNPTIYSQGFVPAPLGQGYISRLVQVVLTNATTFTRGIASAGAVDLSGQALVDSFDSSNTNYSTNGKYDVTKRKANGGIVTNSRNNPAVSVGTGHVYGNVDTGPGGTVTASGVGTVGDLTWTTGIEPGWTNNDSNFSYPDLPAPNSAGWPALASGTYTYAGTNYQYSIGNQNVVYSGDLTVGNTETMVITGSATLYVTGGLSVKGTIYIAPGASFTLYVGGSTASFSAGGVVNANAQAATFSYIGLAGNTTIKYAGSSDFVGTMYAPEANFTLTGGASVCGAVVVNSYTSKSAGAALHYDESLSGPSQYKLMSYREL